MVETLCMAKSDMRSTAHASRGRVRATRKDPHPELTAQLERVQGQATAFELDIDHRHRLMVKHPAKVLWPQLGITTVDLIQYYLRVAPVLLPHTQDRPLSFRRFNEGIEGPSQFHQR